MFFPLPDDHHRCMVFYTIGLDHWQLKEWLPASSAFLEAIEAEPRYVYAGPMHRLISHCYENLRHDDEVDAEEADPIIEWGYQILFDSYPDSPDVGYAALRLGQINLARGRPVSACVYFNFFLDLAHENDGRIPEINAILAQMEGCQQ